MLGLAVNSAAVCSLIAVVVTWWTVSNLDAENQTRLEFQSRSFEGNVRLRCEDAGEPPGGLICFQVDKLIISRFLGIAACSFYEAGSRLTSFMRLCRS